MKGGEKVSEFKCKKCGDVIKETDYGFKDRNLYYALEKEGICEACARGMK